MKNIDRVREFHKTYGCFINYERNIGNFHKSLVVQRFNLISEETSELISAIASDDRIEILDALIDMDYVLDGTYLTFGMEYHPVPEDIEQARKDVVETGYELDFQLTLPLLVLNTVVFMVESYLKNEIDDVEECLHNMSVVLHLMFEELGFADVREDAGIEVHRSNMSKLSAEGHPILRESDGKVMKGPNYSKPNLRQFIDDDKGQHTGTSGTVR